MDYGPMQENRLQSFYLELHILQPFSAYLPDFLDGQKAALTNGLRIGWPASRPTDRLPD